MPTPALDQLELFRRKQAGGKRSGAGRPKTTQSVTMRIPLEFLNVVTEIKNGTHTPAKPTDLNTVTEIKDDATAAQAITALREFYRGEYMMGDNDHSFFMWIDEIAKQGEKS